MCGLDGCRNPYDRSGVTIQLYYAALENVGEGSIMGTAHTDIYASSLVCISTHPPWFASLASSTDSFTLKSLTLLCAVAVLSRPPPPLPSLWYPLSLGSPHRCHGCIISALSAVALPGDSRLLPLKAIDPAVGTKNIAPREAIDHISQKK